MTDLYFLVLTAINLFALAFMCVLVSLNDTLNPKQTRGFLYTFLLIALILILELITVLVDGGPRWMRPIKLPGLQPDTRGAARHGLHDRSERTDQ